MKPLLYLAARSLVNGLKRTLRSPWRLAGVLLLVGYQAFLFVRFVFRPRGAPDEVPTGLPGELALPSPEVLGTWAFAAFLIVVVLNSLGLGSFRATFRAADADMLFPTPVEPRHVIAWRTVSDSLLRLLLPLLLALFALERGRGAVTEGIGGAAGLAGGAEALRLAVVAYLLLAVVYSVWGWALSLWMYQPRLAARGMPWKFGVATTAYALAPAAYLAWQSRTAGFEEAGKALLDSPAVQAAYFPATFATMFATAPLTGEWRAGTAGIAGLCALLGLGWWLTLRNAPLLYEQSALRAYQTTRAMESARTEGTGYSGILRRASSGRLRSSSVPTLMRWRAQGPAALAWKEAILTLRAGLPQIAIGLAVILGGMVAIRYIPADRVRTVLLAVACGLGPLFLAPTTRSTMLPEALSRIDLMKPLPLTSWQLLSWDALARMATPLLASFACLGLAVVLQPGSAVLLLAAWVAGAGLAYACTTSLLPLAIAFPDPRDPAQMAIRGLMGLAVFGLLLGLVAVPPAIAGALRLPVWPGLLAGACLVAAAGLAATLLGGRLYDSFNPSDP